MTFLWAIKIGHYFPNKFTGGVIDTLLMQLCFDSRCWYCRFLTSNLTSVFFADMPKFTAKET